MSVYKLYKSIRVTFQPSLVRVKLLLERALLVLGRMQVSVGLSVLSLGISTLFLPFASKGINIGGGKAEGYAYASTTSTSRSIVFSSASLPTSLRNLVLLSDTLRRRQFSRSSNMARFATHKFFASLVFAATEL